MRRRRKPLEVSTFPFLAVLLCAMGSLILVLLVMDRKAKAVARAKAYAAVAQAADKAELEAAARRAELEQRLQEKRAEKQADWQKKRDALHTKLLTEQQALQLQIKELHDKMVQAAARLRLEQEQSGDLKKKIESERGQLQGEEQALATARRTVLDSESRTEQEKADLVRMTNDIVVLERALRDLKETRERERQTYSVVPYNGKRGESRRPLYIECSGDNAIFHPDKKAVLVRLHPEEIRSEVARRVARQREQAAAAKLPVDQTPYLMLLVRPDGIFSYHAFQAALAGLDVQFGYELIDADWLLDFPEENQPPKQTWQTLAQQPQLPPLDPPPPSDAKVRGVQFGIKPETPSAGNGPARASASGGNSEPGVTGDKPTAPGGLGQPVVTGNGPGTSGASGSGYRGSSTGLPQLPWDAVASERLMAGPNAPRGNSASTTDSKTPLYGQEASATTPNTGTSPGEVGGNQPGTRPGASTMPPGPQTLAQGNAPPSSPMSGGTEPGDRGSGMGVGTGAAGPGLPPLPPGVAPGAPGGSPGSESGAGGQAPTSGAQTPNGPPLGNSGDGSGGGSDGQPQSILRPARVPGSEPKRPAPAMHAARLNGDRDYVIFLECKRDSVVLYPSQREFPLSSLTGGAKNPLVQAVQQMIDRRQSGVRPGEIPYRPQVRFLVRPDTLRVYHTIYPLFDPLPIGKARQNLMPEDDVRSIIAGN